MRLNSDIFSIIASYEHARTIGLRRWIHHEWDYWPAVLEGLAVADRLAESLDLVPRPVEIRAIHCAIFNDIHPWAGELRQPGAEISVASLIGDPPEKLESRLESLCKWAAEDFAWAKGNITRQAHAIASFHIAMKRIQAFSGGNGRTAGVIMEHQVQKCFGLELGDRLDFYYYASLKKGLRAQDASGFAINLLDALKLNREEQKRLSAGGQAQEGTVKEEHVFLHQRMEELRIAEQLGNECRNVRPLPLQSEYDQQLEIEAALTDLEEKPLQLTAPETGSEENRRIDDRELNAGREERLAEAGKQVAAMQGRVQAEQQSHSQSDREIERDSQSH